MVIHQDVEDFVIAGAARLVSAQSREGLRLDRDSREPHDSHAWPGS